MTTRSYHLQSQPIPDGFQIYEDWVDVAGIHVRKSAAIAFVMSRAGWIELERDYVNQHDKNAIQVLGCNKGWFGTKRRLIGYLPRDVSRRVVENGFWGLIRPRLLKTYVGDTDFVEVVLQILGPKGKQYEYNPPKKGRGRHYTDYVERVKQLKLEKRNKDAINLLLELIGKVEKEARTQRGTGNIPTWYHEQLAILYRKEKQYENEVQILERHERQTIKLGKERTHLIDRLIKARQLRDKKLAQQKSS